MEEQPTETQNKHEPKLMKTVASNTKLKRVFEFIQQFKDGITNKIQKLTTFLKDDLYDKTDSLSLETKQEFINMIKTNLSNIIVFNDEWFDSTILKPTDVFVNTFIDFMYKFTYYYKNNRIYVIFSKIETIQRSLKREFADFANYNEYKKNIDNDKLLFDKIVINEQGRVLTTISITEFMQKVINDSYIDHTFNILNEYCGNIQKLQSELKGLQTKNTEITRLLKSSENENYISLVFDYINKTYITNIGDFKTSTKETVMKNIYEFVYIPKFKTLNNKKDSKLNSGVLNVLEYIRSNGPTYDYINSLLNIENIIRNLDKRIAMIDWEIEQTRDRNIFINAGYKLNNSQKLVEYIQNVKRECLPNILQHKFDYDDTRIITHIMNYLNEFAMIVKFFLLKTNGYNELKSKKASESTLDTIRIITLDSNGIDLYDCQGLYNEKLKGITSSIIGVKTTMEKITKELKEAFKSNGIIVDDVSEMFLLIDEIFIRDCAKCTWYIENWWNLTNDKENTEENIRNELKTFIHNSQSAYRIQYTNEYDEELTADANMKNIFNDEIKKKLKLMFQIDILTIQRNEMYDKLKDRFEVVFTQDPKFKYFYDLKPDHWKSYLWWFFNVGIEIEKEKALAKPSVAPCETDNTDLVECEKRNSECKAELATLKGEVERLKRASKEEVDVLTRRLASLQETKQDTKEIIEKITDKIDVIEKQVHDSPKGKPNDDEINRYRAEIQKLENEKQQYLAEQTRIQEEENATGEKLQKCESANLKFRMVIKGHMDELEHMQKQDFAGTKMIVFMSDELAELRNENTQLVQEIESRKQMVLEIEDAIDRIDDNMSSISSYSSVKSDHKNSVSVQTSPMRQTHASMQTSPIRQTHTSMQTSPIENIEIAKLEKEKQKLEKEKQDLEKEKRELLALNAKQTNELKENAEKIKKQSDDIHTLIVKQDNALKEFKEKKTVFESQLTQLKDEKSQQHAQEQREQEKKAQKYKTLYFKKVSETEQLKQQLTKSSPNVASSVGPTPPFSQTCTPLERLSRSYITHIAEFLEQCIKESYSIDRIIRIDDVKKEIRPMFNYQPISPKQLIDLLNTNNAGDVLNRLLYVAITHKTTNIQNKYYVRHLASRCNINPKIQHTARGLTVLDLAVSSGDVDTAHALLKTPLFDINNQYTNHTLTTPHSRPVIEAIKERNIPIIMLVLNDPRCNIHLKDSAGHSPLDYVFAIDGPNAREHRNLLFRLLVHSNKTRGEDNIFSDANIMKRLGMDMTMFHTLLNEDKDLFEKQYREYYKNDAKMMAKLPAYLVGGRRRGVLGGRGGTKRRGRSSGRRQTKRGGQTGIFKGASPMPSRKPKTKRGRSRGGVKHSKTKRRSVV
jgi:hypothetical protein